MAQDKAPAPQDDSDTSEAGQGYRIIQWEDANGLVYLTGAVEEKSASAKRTSD